MRNTSCWMWSQSVRTDLSLDCHGLRCMTQRFNGALVTFNSTRHTAISTAYHNPMTYSPSHLSSPVRVRIPRSPSCETHLMHNSPPAAHLTAQVGTCIPWRTLRFPLVSALLSTLVSPCNYPPEPIVASHHAVVWLGNRVSPRALESLIEITPVVLRHCCSITVRIPSQLPRVIGWLN